MQQFQHQVIEIEKKSKTLLIITSASGGGHLQAAKATAAKALAKDPDIKIIQKDLLIDFVGKRFGKFFVHLWNASQKKGNLTALTFLSKNIRAADFFFHIRILSKVFPLLLKEDVDQIIDTQPVGTAAIIKAIKYASRITKKSLKLEKILTELPTKNTFHFFKPIKNLSNTNRSLIRLITTVPLLKPNQNADAFWEKYCGLKESDVSYENFPLRKNFEKYQKLLSHPFQKMQVEIKVKNSLEKSLIADTLKKGNAHTEIYRNKMVLMIEPQDRVSTILLGSQPTEEATIKYVKIFIQMVKSSQHKSLRHFLFVFCNHDAIHRGSLLRRLHEMIQKEKFYPSSLNIIPMCFQDDEVIAPLYFRSNATFTRSGGMTSMELMALTRGKIWIHSEIKKKTKHFSKGMPCWEQGNAYYLRAKKGAQFITPETFPIFCRSYFN